MPEIVRRLRIPSIGGAGHTHMPLNHDHGPSCMRLNDIRSLEGVP